MLIKIGTALVFVALSAPAFAQALGGFETIQGNSRRERNIPPQYRTTLSNSSSTAPAMQSQIGPTAPSPAFSGTYSHTYSGTYGNTLGNPSPPGR